MSSDLLCGSDATLPTRLAWRIATVVAIAGACSCAPPAAPRAVVAPTPPTSLEEAQRALREGDLRAAEKAYHGLGEAARHDALVGRAAVALARDDRATMTALWPQMRRLDEPTLATNIAAGEVALRLDLDPEQTKAIQAQVCAGKDDEALGREAGQVCAHLVARARRQGSHRCVAGCGRDHRLPLSLVGNLPVVMVAVGKLEPVPFIVDTGASSGLITPALAAQAGIEPIRGTTMAIGAAGGHSVEAELANLTLRLGEMTIEDAEAVILDLPLEGIGGIISPQTTLSSHRVTIDTASFALVLEPLRSAPPEGVERLPWLLHERRPVLVMAVGGRSPRPLLLDTGARASAITTKLDALGTPLSRVAADHGHGAGGSRTKSWTTSDRVPFVAGPLSWSVAGPSVTERRPPSGWPAIEIMGTVGMDAIMGRRLVVSSPERGLWLSGSAALARWSIGDIAQFEIRRGDAEPFTLDERVVERDANTVTIEVDMVPADGPRRFRFRMVDDWSTRGTWLVTRKALELWDLAASEATAAPPGELAKRYLPAFVPFETGGAPRIRAITLRRGATELLCSEIAVDATAHGAPATFRFVECPADPWRVARLELTGEDGVLIWSARRLGLQDPA